MFIRLKSGRKKLNDEPLPEKTNVGSDLVRHKPACRVTEAGQKLEYLGLNFVLA